jgi:5-methyltetrahydrofolate--homocysteine methyltransferase
MRASLSDLLATRSLLLADGATGTNFFEMGLTSGEPPELWNVEHPDRVRLLHQQFVDAGADILLTNSFGANRHRLALHGNEHRTYELAHRSAEIAREVADAAARPVVVAGSVGPTGELFDPLGTLVEPAAIEAFQEEIEGLRDGGADVAWIETMSAVEEVRAAARAAIAVGIPYTATCTFDTAGRTMMGLAPDELAAVFDDLDPGPIAFGANCGVGASDILVSLLGMARSNHGSVLISKGNCGVPRFHGTEVVYSGTPELMGRYAQLAANGGARIIGGCCGTSPSHLAAMRTALDAHVLGAAPTVDDIVAAVGPLANKGPEPRVEGRSNRRRSA